MSKYSKFEVDKVKKDADIRRLIPGASEHTVSYTHLTLPTIGG